MWTDNHSWRIYKFTRKTVYPLVLFYRCVSLWEWKDRKHVNGLFVIKEHVYFQVWRSNCQESHHFPLAPLLSPPCILLSVFRVMFHRLKCFLSAHHYNRELIIPLSPSPSLSLSWFSHKSNRITTHCSAKDRDWRRRQEDRLKMGRGKWRVQVEEQNAMLLHTQPEAPRGEQTCDIWGETERYVSLYVSCYIKHSVCWWCLQYLA